MSNSYCDFCKSTTNDVVTYTPKLGLPNTMVLRIVDCERCHRTKKQDVIKKENTIE